MSCLCDQRKSSHQELRETITELDIEWLNAKGIERHPSGKPRIIHDNDPQFVPKGFNDFVRDDCVSLLATSHPLIV
ncbi:MAG: hypothetical protein WCK15_10690 [Pirellula sp.]